MDGAKLYFISNTVKPPFYQTDYPYNALSASKIIFTQNKIKIFAANYDQFIKKKFSQNSNIRKPTKQQKKPSTTLIERVEKVQQAVDDNAVEETVEDTTKNTTGGNELSEINFYYG